MKDLGPRHNRILAALPDRELSQLAEELEPVDLTAGAVLYEPGERITYAYFVLIGVVSLVANLESGQIVEVATIGDEGIVGLPVFLGTSLPSERAAVQIPGSALRISADRLRNAIAADHPSLQLILQRYTQTVFTQLARNAACNHAHNTRQRCARWLLMSADRMHADTFDLTQEFLAQMLAVRRASVSEVASALAEDGCIRYSRGRITVLDRHRLEANACDCYHVIRDTLADAYHDLRSGPPE
jgi:CRP-like cAMP-binding protein